MINTRNRNVLYHIKLRGYREYFTCRDEATWDNIFTSKKVMIEWIDELVKHKAEYDGQIVILALFIQKYIRGSDSQCYVTNEHVDFNFTTELDYMNTVVRRKKGIKFDLTTRLKDF